MSQTTNCRSKNGFEILPKSPLKQGSQNIFGIPNTNRWTHIRLNIYQTAVWPRLKVYGTVQKIGKLVLVTSNTI